MKRRITIMVIIVLIAISSTFASTSKHKVAVLYNKKSSINRKTLEFMGDHFKELGNKYIFKALKKPDGLVKGEYKTIIILSTGFKTGIDPVFSKFIDSWQNKSEIVVVNLVKGSKNYSVKKLTPENSSYGVDVISSASLWNDSSEDMHTLWIKEVINFLMS